MTVAVAVAGSTTDSFWRYHSPFTQRVWMALELKRTQYQYIEIDPFEKPGWFLAMHPRGVVPLLSHGDWVCYESSVILEYVSPTLVSVDVVVLVVVVVAAVAGPWTPTTHDSH